MIGIFSNKIICFAALFSTFMVALVVFMPSLAYAFRLARLSPEMYLTALLLSIIPIPVIEIAKLAGLIKKE
jgi:Ca2+-transporting ATPase